MARTRKSRFKITTVTYTDNARKAVTAAKRKNSTVSRNVVGRFKKVKRKIKY